jgi:hypothetical protein
MVARRRACSPAGETAASELVLPADAQAELDTIAG